jgi:hypothetical protein
LSVSLVSEERQLTAERLALDAAWVELHASKEEWRQAGEAERQRHEQAQEGSALETEAATKLQEAERCEVAAAKLELDSRRERQDSVERQLEERSLALSKRELEISGSLQDLEQREAAAAQLEIDLQREGEKQGTLEAQLEEHLWAVAAWEDSQLQKYNKLNEHLWKREEEARAMNNWRLADEHVQMREDWH